MPSLLWKIAVLTLLILVPLWAWLLLSALHRGRFAAVYRARMAESRRERLFLASFAFFITFSTVRVLTHMIRAGVGPFHNISMGGRHIHHLVWGILLLLTVGYLWLAEVGTGSRESSIWMGRVTALMFGLGAALTLDEFALWLNLEDVYWTPQGRASVRAALFFGGLLSVGVWGHPLFHALAKEAISVFRPRRSKTSG
jgi:hypothetical protein